MALLRHENDLVDEARCRWEAACALPESHFLSFFEQRARAVRVLANRDRAHRLVTRQPRLRLSGAELLAPVGRGWKAVEPATPVTDEDAAVAQASVREFLLTKHGSRS